MTRWQRIGLLLLLVGAIAGTGYIAVTSRKRGKRWFWLLPEMRQKVTAIEREAKRQGLDVMFWDGWRDPAETLQNIAKGTSWVKDAYGSEHTWGAAADIVFKTALGLPSWPDKTDPRWQKLGAIGKSLGLKWGGDYRTRFDGPHFYLPNFNMTVARNKYGINYQGWLSAQGIPIPGATQEVMTA